MSCSETKFEWMCCCGFKQNECTFETKGECPKKRRFSFIGYYPRFDQLKHITNIESGEEPNLQELAKGIKHISQVKPKSKSKYHK